MKKVSSHPIKNATDRKAMLSEMKELFDRGCREDFFSKSYKTAIGFEIDRAMSLKPRMEASAFQNDINGALKHFNTSRAFIFKSETDEHRLLREAAEKVARLHKELSDQKKSSQVINQRSEEEIKKELRQTISTMAQMAKEYISKKGTFREPMPGRTGSMVLQSLECWERRS